MKKLILTLLMSSSFTAYAEDTVYCKNGLDITFTDQKNLRVSLPDAELKELQVKYKNQTSYTSIKNNSKYSKEINSVRAVFDNGTSILHVYVLDYTKFEDGSVQNITHTLIKPTGIEPKNDLACMGAQS